MLARKIWAFVWKDCRLFMVDRQAVVMSFVVPVLIASILGWLDSSASSDTPSEKIPMLFVDQDGSLTSQTLLKQLGNGNTVDPVPASLAHAREMIQSGDTAVAVIIPKGFGHQAAQSLGGALLGGKKPELTFLEDPSKRVLGQIVQGTVVEKAASIVAKQSFGALAGDGAAPFEIKTLSGASAKVKWGSAAHDYAGFGIQGLLFFAMESAVGLARERRMGIWRRLAAAPISPSVVVWSKGISSMVLAFAILLGVFCVGALLFGIRILGSGFGFFEIVLATAAMAAAFGLAIATIGKTETQSRGLSILLILVMLATGGAWFPLERMPYWVQSIANWLPVHWAVGGLDAVTWRGEGLLTASRYAGSLLCFAGVFLLISTVRFKSLAARTP